MPYYFYQTQNRRKKQQEIASELNLTPKTVENQIGIGYKKLRKELKNYMPLLLFLLG